MVVFDVDHVFRSFGGPRGLLDVINLYQPGTGLTYNAVQMWSQRQTLPAKWVGVVLYAIEQKGWNCTEFLTDGDEFVARPGG
jgi:hypothetical protein